MNRKQNCSKDLGGNTTDSPALAKAILVHSSADMYGSDRMALESAVALTRMGLDVTIVLPCSGPLVKHCENHGIQVRILPVPILRKSIMNPKGVFKYAIQNLGGIVRAYRYMKSVRPRFVYVNTMTQSAWLIAATLARYPTLLHVRESEHEQPTWVRHALVAPAYLASSVVANSNDTRRFIQKSLVFGRKEVRVIYNGKRWETLPEQSKATPIGDGQDAKIALVGRVSPRKGQDIAIRALSKVVDAGWDIELVLVGDVFPGYEWYAEELRSLAKALGVEARVTWTGFVHDVRQILDIAIIAIVPSRIEPFGTVAVEAMARRKPTIVSNVGGLTEIVSHENTGLVFDTESADSLAQMILALLQSVSLRTRLADAAYRSVLFRFSQETYREQVRSAVEPLLAEGLHA
ncbi:glycosyltransferase family 4 protein [Williamsia sp. M5A3_1d]